MRFLKLAPFCLLFISITSFAQDGDGNGLRLSTLEELRSEFDSVPCKNGERLKAVKSLFEEMGADPAEITVEKFRNVENLVIRKPGALPETTKEKIVIGAHYDKTDIGCGAVDNWTGIVALAHVYRSLREAMLNKTVVFVAFGKEEIGLVGSTAMVDAIKKEEREEYCAMINIDSLGLAGLQVADNLSSKNLVDFSANLAREMNMPFKHGQLIGGASDSNSFINKKIPAVMIHALSIDWNRILHTGFDQAAKVKAESVYSGYRLALALLVRIDKMDCQAFRKK